MLLCISKTQISNDELFITSFTYLLIIHICDDDVTLYWPTNKHPNNDVTLYWPTNRINEVLIKRILCALLVKLHRSVTLYRHRFWGENIQAVILYFNHETLCNTQTSRQISISWICSQIRCSNHLYLCDNYVWTDWWSCTKR